MMGFSDQRGAVLDKPLTRRLTGLRIALIPSLILVAGCDKVDFDCTSVEAKEALITAAKRDISREIAENIKDIRDANPESSNFGGGMVKQLVDKFNYELTAVTEVWQNDAGDQKSCRGTLAITVDPDIVRKADEGRAVLDLNTVADLSAQSAVEFDAKSRFSQEIDFGINKVDKSRAISAEPGTNFTLFDVAGELGAYQALSASLVRSKKDETNRELQAQTEQQKAALDLARAENRAAVQAVQEIWSALEPAIRSDLLARQRAWIRKKNADCRLESINSSENAADIVVNQINCDTRAQIERADWLRPYLPAQEY
ncbi:MAG: hypothetical protein RLZZ561_1403 [Pseudomonadota bacterium]|jgi:uncharacterized protein YecT (DUF1311 family)